MASLERVVRPAVMPDIRPPLPRDARGSASSDPDEGLGVIAGGGGTVINLAQSFRSSTQKQHQSEEYRVSDIIRVYRIKTTPKPPPGTVDPSYDPKAPRQSNERIDYNVWIDHENMWQIIHVLHTGETRRTFYRRVADHLDEDYPKGNARVVKSDIVVKTRGGRGYVDLILP